MTMLVIAPHPDDETLGTGGTIARSTAAGVPVTILTVSAHMPPLYSEETHQQTVAEARKAHAELGVSDSRFMDIPAVYVRDTPVPELNGPIIGCSMTRGAPTFGSLAALLLLAGLACRRRRRL